MRLVLLENGMDIRTIEEEKFEFILDIAKGKMKYEKIRIWIQTNLIKNVL